MYTRFLTFLFICAFVAVGTIHAQAPSTAQATPPRGEVKVAKVTGTVTMILAGLPPTLLTGGETIPVSAKVITAKVESSVILVFSNRAQTQLGSDSELVIEEFLQDPYKGLLKIAETEEEPTSSQTTIRLNRGDLVGKVKLRAGSGSKFTVNTPVGAAGIRGTTFRIVYRPDPITGLVRFTLTNVNGGVDFNSDVGRQSSTPTVTATGSVAGMVIPPGEEIIVFYTQDSQGQFVPVVPFSSTPPTVIPSVMMQEVSAVSQVIAQAVQQVVFTAPPQSATQISGQTATGQTVTGEVKIGPPPVVPDTPRLTNP